MAKKAIKKTDRADQSGSAETQNQTKEVKLEVVKPAKPAKPTKTLEEMETAIEKAGQILAKNAWAFAKAIFNLHESKLYPHADETSGFYRYMEERWGIKKAQSANYIRWIKDEIQLKVEQLRLLDQDESAKVDSIVEPPETPHHKSVTKSRDARKKSEGKGFKYHVAVKEDGKWNIKKVSDSTAKRHGYQTFSNQTEAEQYLEKCAKEEEELNEKQEQELKEKHDWARAALDEVFPDRSRPTGDLNQTDVALSPGDDQPQDEDEITDGDISTYKQVTELKNKFKEVLMQALDLLGDRWVREFVEITVTSYVEQKPSAV